MGVSALPDVFGRSLFFKWSRDRVWRLPPRRLQKFRVFKGRMRFGLHKILPQPATYLAVMREPIDRVISVFYFMRNYKVASELLEVQAREMNGGGFHQRTAHQRQYSMQDDRGSSL